ncbi:MAG: FkbM family methyltransferase [Verrucomicrobiaceae bacterium]|nr:FkbM family methyltransferase [Verrucomicrobiaceae bacterium]
MKCFADHATRNMQFLDVGTHWGVFTLAAIHYGGKGVRVVGIEASSDAVAVYKENLQLNNVVSQVDIINAACGESVGELKMLTTGAGGADYLVVPAGERFDTVTVPQVTIDSTVVSAGFKPTHVKIDVEGFEEEVLRGAFQTLRNFKPTVFLELHGLLINNRGKRPQNVLGLLREAGYSKWLNLDNQVITTEELEACGYNARFIAINPVG